MVVNKKNSLIILYLTRNNFTLFFNKSNSLTFTFPNSSIKELEVIDSDLFITEVSKFIQLNKILPTQLLILLSPEVTYEKTFIDENQNKVATEQKADNKDDINTAASNIIKPIVTEQEQRAIEAEERIKQIRLFLEYVPIEDIASKTYKVEKGLKVIATNKKLYEIIIEALNTLSFTVELVIPLSILTKELSNVNTFDQNSADIIFKKIVSIKQYSLLIENSPYYVKQIPETYHIKITTKVTSKREYALLGLFVILLLTLGIFSYNYLSSTSNNRKVASVLREPTIVQAVPTLIPTVTGVSSESANFKMEDMKILINNGTDLQINLLKQDFINEGFKNIITKPNNVPASGKASIVFSLAVPQKSREKILEYIKRNLLNISVMEAASPEADLIINL